MQCSCSIINSMKKEGMKQFLLISRTGEEYPCILYYYEVVEPESLLCQKDILSETETEEYDSITANKRKLSYMLGRYCAKKAITGLVMKNPKHIIVENAIFEQPVVNVPDISISITHSDQVGACVCFSNKLLMGIDVENIKPSKYHVLDSIAQEEEKRILSNILGDELTALTVLWTIKEALGKAIFTGITISEKLTTIKQAKKEADYVVAYVHWGTEYSTKLEDAQITQGKEYIEAGADAVIGGHPHRVQGIEYINNVPVCYSLGNFWFSTMPSGIGTPQRVRLPALYSLQACPVR